jgi:hypothetical protein
MGRAQSVDEIADRERVGVSLCQARAEPGVSRAQDRRGDRGRQPTSEASKTALGFGIAMHWFSLGRVNKSLSNLIHST